jgi:hypothetical protein
MAQVGINVELGNDGLMKMSGNTAHLKTLTEGLNKETADGLKKDIMLMAQLLADQDDGVIRGYHMRDALKTVTTEFALSVIEADRLNVTLAEIPRNITTTHTIVSKGRNAEDSFATGTGGYRTVPYDGYSPTLHKGEGFNVIPASQYQGDGGQSASGGASGVSDELLKKTNDLLEQQLIFSQQSARNTGRMATQNRALS